MEEQIQNGRRILVDWLGRHKAIIEPNGFVILCQDTWTQDEAEELRNFLTKDPTKPHYQITRTFELRPVSVELTEAHFKKIGLKKICRVTLTEDDIEKVWK